MRRVPLFVLGLTACAAPSDDGPDETDETDAETDVVEDDTEPELPPPAEPAAYSNGDCPTLAAGLNEDFPTGNKTRDVIVRVPARTKGAGVVFLWHGNGDQIANFDAYMGGQALADELKAYVVVPQGVRNQIQLDWSFPPADPTNDARLFDDLLACLAAQEPELDLSRVYTAGFSAGALFSSWLVMNRGDHLAAAVVFSGGTDGSLGIGPKVNPYSTPPWRIPVVLTHGGATDEVVVKFKPMTENFAEQLAADGHVAILCPHSQGHTPPSGFSAWAWPFLKAHRYGLEPSPYADEADPSGELPSNCTWY